MRFRVFKTLALAAALVLSAAAPAAAQVPDPFARQLAQQLAAMDERQAEFGFSRAAGPFAGGLREAEMRRFPLTLRAGQPYAVAGLCETRCGDLDFRLVDPRGEVVTQDLSPGPRAAVAINPPMTGAYQLEAVMARCAAAECYFAFNVYAR